MMLSEFVERTGFEPTPAEYTKIEEAYCNFNGDKDAFCKAFVDGGGEKKIYQARVAEIDRLNGKILEILEEWRNITKEIGANIQVIDMPLLNTDSPHGDLTGAFISDLVLQILAYVAETERLFIKRRQAEGIAAAKANGVKFGCPKLQMPVEFEKYFRMWEHGKISTREAAKLLNVSHTTFYRRCLEQLEEI